MCARIISPADNLREPFYTPDLRAWNAAATNDFIPFRVFLLGDQRNSFGSTHLTVPSVVMADPDDLLIRNPEINGAHRILAATLDFPQPLVGHIKTPSNRHGEDAIWLPRLTSAA